MLAQPFLQIPLVFATFICLIYETSAYSVFSLSSSTLWSNAKLVVAGRGDLERETRVAVESVGGVFLGGVSEEEKLRLYQSAWVVLSTSFIEGWGMTVVEANACGTPVVGYATGSIPEII